MTSVDDSGSSSVLISSAGRRAALIDIFRQAQAQAQPCGQGRVLAADASPYAAALWQADAHFVVPPCTDASFVPTMLDLCARERVSLLVPTIDTELATYARHREDFLAVGTLLAISGPATIDIAVDKRSCHSFLVENGFPTVAQAEIADVRANPEKWRFPLIVKPVNGSASRGVVLANNASEFEIATGAVDVIAQRPAPGSEFTTDVFIDQNGQCRGAVPRERLAVRGGEVVKARTARIDPLIALVEKLAASLPDAFGVLNVQAFYDHDTGEMNVIEINPRFGGGFPLSDRAGAPFARWLVELSFDRAVSYEVAPWQEDLVMLRYDAAAFIDQKDMRRP
jgi:carbamoyl-phosphate synthase large subunit